MVFFYCLVSSSPPPFAPPHDCLSVCLSVYSWVLTSMFCTYQTGTTHPFVRFLRQDLTMLLMPGIKALYPRETLNSPSPVLPLRPEITGYWLKVYLCASILFVNLKLFWKRKFINFKERKQTARWKAAFCQHIAHYDEWQYSNIILSK